MSSLRNGHSLLHPQPGDAAPCSNPTRSAQLFVRTLYEYRAQHKYRLHEFVVMPDHFHLLITVGSEITIERAMQFIKGGFAFRAGRELRDKVANLAKRFFRDTRS